MRNDSIEDILNARICPFYVVFLSGDVSGFFKFKITIPPPTHNPRSWSLVWWNTFPHPKIIVRRRGVGGDMAILNSTNRENSPWPLLIHNSIGQPFSTIQRHRVCGPLNYTHESWAMIKTRFFLYLKWKIAFSFWLR